MNIGSEIVSLRQNAQVLSKMGQSPISMWPAGNGRQPYERSRATNWTINQTSFDQLLSWLGPNPEMAGQKYEIIRQKLIRLFTSKHCDFPEDLADKTFDRVARRLSQIRQHYVGNPLNYFLGVARKIYLEYLRSISTKRLPSLPAPEEGMEELFAHLEDCINQLPPEERELILAYYQENGRSKIDHRKKLAEELGIPLSALRLRVHRIVSRLRKKLIGTSTLCS